MLAQKESLEKLGILVEVRVRHGFVVDQIFAEVLKTFSSAETLTTSLQDWRKGRRAEVQEVNGWVEIPGGMIQSGDTVAVTALQQLIQGAPVRATGKV